MPLTALACPDDLARTARFHALLAEAGFERIATGAAGRAFGMPTADGRYAVLTDEGGLDLLPGLPAMLWIVAGRKQLHAAHAVLPTEIGFGPVGDQGAAQYHLMIGEELVAGALRTGHGAPCDPVSPWGLDAAAVCLVGMLNGCAELCARDLP